MDLYLRNALEISKITTKNYSTSFSLGIRLLSPELRQAIYGIYGFVRFADEIVDTFYDHDREKMMAAFRKETFQAIDEGISSNPILHSYQYVVNTYNIPHDLIDAFLKSMEMDLNYTTYASDGFKTYIYGSAEVVGLMCLKVFYKDEDEKYETLKYPARKLGEAFQKVNFLRDLKDDMIDRGRFYFPQTDFYHFDNESKRKIEEDIQHDFDEAFKGIRKLKPAARIGVYLAYRYYTKLFEKLKKTDASELVLKRHRISNAKKVYILLSSTIRQAAGIY
ncbi:MAG: phytoene/squalene synthase family protein [bacterium]|jgi:15-cis-phytoene synthase